MENLFLIHLGVISTLYNPPRKDLSKLVPLRGVPFLKLFIITYVWASIGVFFPFILEGNGASPTFVIRHFIAACSYIIAITLPFDIRDYDTDPSKGIVTFPHILGIRTTKVVALGFLLIFYLLIRQNLTHDFLIMAFAAIVALLIIASDRSRPSWYFTGLVDGSIIIYYFIVVYSIE
jgi:4-hydroxybenzoate polyprenyltransferase